MSPTLLHGLIAGLVLLPAIAVADDETDRLLRHLRGVQEANLIAVKKGIAEYKLSGLDGTTAVSAEATVTWDDKNTHLHYRYENRLASQKDGLANFPFYEMILTPKSRAFLTGSKLELRDKPQPIVRDLRLRPDESWFSIDVWGRPWKEMLDLSIFPASKHKYVATEAKAEGTITVKRDSGADGTLAIEFAVTKGSNVSSYSYSGKQISASGSYEWARTDSGTWYPTRISLKKRQGSHSSSYDIQVSRFSDNHDIPANRFDVKSLTVSPGIRVDEISTAGRRSSRIPYTEADIRKALDTISDKLRESGFASPDRKGS